MLVNIPFAFKKNSQYERKDTRIGKGISNSEPL